MGVTNPFVYKGEELLLEAFRCAYLNPESRSYRWTYRPDEPSARRMLFPRKVFYKLGIPAKRSASSVPINIPLKLFVGTGEEVDAAAVNTMDEILGKNSGGDIRQFAKEEGKKYCRNLSGIMPESFDKEKNFLGVVFDIFLGARGQDIGKPEPGSSHYKYPIEQYPFLEGSLSELVYWCFRTGAEEELGRKYWSGAKPLDMRTLVIHEKNMVEINSKDSIGFNITKIQEYIKKGCIF